MAIITKGHGTALPLGISVTEDKINFSVSVPGGKACKLLIYEKGKQAPCASFEMEKSVGDVYSLCVQNPADKRLEYVYEIDGQTMIDPYANGLGGREVWRGDTVSEPTSVRAVISQESYDWEGDRPLQLPYQDVIAYALHVRGFTKDSSSKVEHKGTFQGVIEKLPYLTELGINQIQCMPIYEFDEYGVKTNYWGYGPGYYFAPKSSYSADGDGQKGLKDMVKACHLAGIEVVLEMPFAEDTSVLMMMECLRYYVMEYHIDGFVLNPYRIPFDCLKKDPILSQTKLMKHQEDFQTAMRRFLKGDEGLIPDVMFWFKHLSAKEGIFNYITTHTGFTLQDLVSYDGKHNEINGEYNQDGPNYNYSWNCGAEGPSRKKAVVELRGGQMRNAMFLLLLAQGTPCILAGDEFGNSQKGNNNVYCQDNPIGWLNWKKSVKDREFCQFVKKLIAFRKRFDFFHSDMEFSGVDRTGCGLPDVSYHGEMAWRAPMEVSSRQLGVFYGADTDSKSSLFIAYNMHWLEHAFALPAPGKNKKWYLVASTQDGILEGAKCLEDQRSIEASARTILVLEGK